jgi:hypothetical protein
MKTFSNRAPVTQFDIHHPTFGPRHTRQYLEKLNNKASTKQYATRKKITYREAWSLIPYMVVTCQGYNIEALLS